MLPERLPYPSTSARVGVTETSMGVGMVGRGAGEGLRIGLRLRGLIEVIYIVVFVTIFIYKIFSNMRSKLSISYFSLSTLCTSRNLQPVLLKVNLHLKLRFI